MLTRGEYIYSQVLRVAAFVTMLIAICFLGILFISKWEYFKLVITVCVVAVAIFVTAAIVCYGILFFGLICACEIKRRVTSTNKILVAYSVVSLKIAQRIFLKHGGLTTYSKEEDYYIE